ncbi:GatB/YqeY domain-containing protein [Candidatus Uhrbacteria bacterium]|nr:GatB/YqeY domain-containing protein [Candidatus Uhrbacteria bacterium]
MSLIETITQNMKLAMKAKDNATLSTLRLLLSAIKNKQIDLQHELSDAEVQDVIKSQVKQLKDSIESFVTGGREDMAVSSQVEVVVLEQYLPAQMPDEELMVIVKEAIEASGVTSKEEMGRAMGVAMKAVAGRADGTRVKQIVGTLLGAFIPVMFAMSLVAHEAQAAIPLVENFANGVSYTEFLLRMFRVLTLWLGIVAITLILNGGFQYMTASYRDKEHDGAISKITIGVFSTMIVAALFAFCTIALQQIS